MGLRRSPPPNICCCLNDYYGMNKITTALSGLAGMISGKSWEKENTTPAAQIDENTHFSFGGGSSVSSLLNSGRKMARARATIYDLWAEMEGCPIISAAGRIQTTSALGGHETTGDIVFIEPTAAAKKDKTRAKMVDEIAASICPILNREAFTLAYTGWAFGDSYARMYSEKGVGLVDLYTQELVRPNLVMPYEQGNRTVGFLISSSGRKFVERLNTTQMARLKMPRTTWVPQYGVIEKSIVTALAEDDRAKLPILPSMVGGSSLFSAEGPYHDLISSLAGLVGQRWLDSIDEQILTVNMDGMTKAQQERYSKSVTEMLERSKGYADKVIKEGVPLLTRIRHLLPIFSEKQVLNLNPTNSNARTSSISTEDVMLHARLLAASLGTDLSMIGFADQLSGGLGDGGFFRVSAQAAEIARTQRHALTEAFNHMIDVHTLNRYGMVFPAHERPWSINFYGAISALNTEQQENRTEAMQTGMQMAQAMDTMKNLGADEETMAMFLSKVLLVDEDLSKLMAKVVVAKGDAAEMGM